MISLRSDLERRCQEVGLNAGRWPDQAARHARIVLVTPESAVTKAFHRFINGKQATRELDRIVVDESHIILDSTETWRPKVLELAEFAGRGCQMVTLPTLVFPRERRRLSGFAHGPTIVARETRRLSFPAKQTICRIVAHVQRVAFLLYDSLRLVNVSPL